MREVEAVRPKGRKKMGKGRPAIFNLPKETLLQMHSLMVKSRVLEERLIKIYKAGGAYFWIGGPGEEGVSTALGLLARQGQGPLYDYFHLHYRSTPTLVALGMEMIDSIRLIMNRATDPCTGGRNFCNHYCYPQWNVVPVSSPIEVQLSAAIGTAWVQKRNSSKGITIVTGGDAGSAEGDFASSLIWSSRKGNELPMLIVVTNNRWGISTKYEGQHGETSIVDRGKAFNIRTAVINGTDPVESYIKLKEEMNYIRRTGKPVLVEAHVSRLFGHSSADGANRRDEVDGLKDFEIKLAKEGIRTRAEIKELWEGFEKEGKAAQLLAAKDPFPTSESVWDHYYANNENGDWRKF